MFPAALVVATAASILACTDAFMPLSAPPRPGLCRAPARLKTSMGVPWNRYARTTGLLSLSLPLSLPFSLSLCLYLPLSLTRSDVVELQPRVPCVPDPAWLGSEDRTSTTWLKSRRAPCLTFPPPLGATLLQRPCLCSSCVSFSHFAGGAARTLASRQGCRPRPAAPLQEPTRAIPR